MIFSSLFNTKANSPVVPRGDFSSVIFGENFTPPPAKSRDLLVMYRKHPWVRGILSKIGQSVAKQPWYFEDANGERINEHPALEFIRSGNPKLRGQSALKVTIAQYDLTGESFWIIGREGNRPNGKPIMFAPIPSTMVQDVPTDNDDPDAVYEVVPVRGTLLKIPSRDVVWFKDADPLEPFERGCSISEAAYTELKTDEAASDYLYSFLKNRARPDMIVSGSEKAPINEKTRPRLEEHWLNRFRGAANAGRPFFSTQELKVQELGKSLRDQQFSELSTHIASAISEIYGVPPEILGRVSGSNRATIENADYLFARYTIDPRLSAMLEELWPFIRQNFDVQGLTLKYESPIAENAELALKVMQTRPGAFTGNEVRALAKHKARPELDDLPEPAPSAPDGDDKAPEPEPPKEDDKPEKKAPEARAKIFDAGGIVSVSSVFEEPEVTAQITRTLDEITGELLEKFGDDLLATLEAGADFQLTGRVVDWLIEEVPGVVRQVNETTRKELQSALLEGVAAGKTVEELVSIVDDLFEDFANTRAPIIGQTLATKVTGFASVEAARQAGFEAKRWLTSQDQVVRASHASLNGQIRPVNEHFQASNGARAIHPGAFGQASEDVNCRCAVRPVLDGEKARGMSDAEFLAFAEAENAKIAKRLSATQKAFFDVQKVLVTNRFRMLTGLQNEKQ